METILKAQFFILLGLVLALFGVLFWKFLELKKKMDKILGNEAGENPENDFLRRLVKAEIKLDELTPKLSRTEARAASSLYKIGFMRFNPFNDTGGDNSFVLGMLDSENSGVLISSLYTRESMRLYAKNVENGKSKYALSEEEKKVLAQAMEKNY